MSVARSSDTRHSIDTWVALGPAGHRFGDHPAIVLAQLDGLRLQLGAAAVRGVEAMVGMRDGEATSAPRGDVERELDRGHLRCRAGEPENNPSLGGVGVPVTRDDNDRRGRMGHNS